MQKLLVFNSVSLDGYFTGKGGDLSWAHAGADDPEWKAFVGQNAGGNGTLLMGRKTYEMMAGYWPTPAARQNDPKVADGMNTLPKVVFSRSMETAAWSHTRVVKSDPAAEVRRLKQEDGGGLTVLGSGTIVSLLAAADLVDEYQVVLTPVVLGEGRTMFEGLANRRGLALLQARPFRNGRVVLTNGRASEG
jgi:dihydrofolate reductase